MLYNSLIFFFLSALHFPAKAQYITGASFQVGGCSLLWGYGWASKPHPNFELQFSQHKTLFTKDPSIFQHSRSKEKVALSKPQGLSTPGRAPCPAPASPAEMHPACFPTMVNRVINTLILITTNDGKFASLSETGLSGLLCFLS